MTHKEFENYKKETNKKLENYKKEVEKTRKEIEKTRKEIKKAKKTIFKEKELLGIIIDFWYQYAYEGGKNRQRLRAGGLSTLERCETALRQRGLLNQNGKLTPQAKKILNY